VYDAVGAAAPGAAGVAPCPAGAAARLPMATTATMIRITTTTTMIAVVHVLLVQLLISMKKHVGLFRPFHHYILFGLEYDADKK
jgi:hypothetical protein